MARPRTTTSVVPLDASHVPAAATLAAEGVARLRERVPALPAPWAHEAVVGRLVRALVERGSGVALVRADGTLLGFQAATLIDGHGGRWAYTPDLGHATATGVDTERAVEQLYGAIAGPWVREACVEHVVTVLAGERATMDAYARLGFAPHVVDLVRDLSPVTGARRPRGVEVRRAVPGDAPAVLELHEGLVRHLRAAPIFLRIPNAPALELQRVRIADPASATFVAVADGTPIAFIRIGPSADDVATIVRDPETASITGAFTVGARRGGGVASALLAAAVAWARDEGYARCAVDHEAANGEASRFWARHCTPVAVSLARRLPPQTVPGVG